MFKQIALIGAGGKMGRKLTRKLSQTNHEVYYVEVSESGVQFLTDMGLSVTPIESATEKADVIILAIPDVLIERIATSLVPQMKTGSMLMLLDPAAAYLGQLPTREDLTYFVSHPCHTSMFNREQEFEARHDYFGGELAKQAIVCALVQGPEDDYALGKEIAEVIYGPILRSHRVSLEQMAILEPGLSETLAALCTTLLKEATEEVGKYGVPLEAARDFVLGHIYVEMAVNFGIIDGRLSDACYVAIDYGKKHVLKDNWKDVLSPEKVRETIDYMVHPEKMNAAREE